MNNKFNNSSYEIAHITQKEEDAIKKAESTLKSETGKEFVIIAWEKK